jgi:DNA repair protein RecO (recombination protein O)
MRYSDSSIIATVLTPERGVESILAKGARSAKSRIAGLLQPLEETELQYYAKPGRELHLLRSAERLVVRRRVHLSYDHMLAGLAMAEIVLRLELPGHPADQVYAIFSEWLQALDTAESNTDAFPVAFAFRFAAAHGFPISIVGDEEFAMAQRYVFSYDRGQLLPSQVNLGGAVLDAESARTLVQLVSAPAESISMLTLSKPAVGICREIATRFLAYHFERPVQWNRLS